MHKPPLSALKQRKKEIADVDFFFFLHSPVRNSFWINFPVFRDNPNSLLFPLHGLDDILVSTYHIQGKLYTKQTFTSSPFFLSSLIVFSLPLFSAPSSFLFLFFSLTGVKLLVSFQRPDSFTGKLRRLWPGASHTHLPISSSHNHNVFCGHIVSGCLLMFIWE